MNTSVVSSIIPHFEFIEFCSISLHPVEKRVEAVLLLLHRNTPVFLLLADRKLKHFLDFSVFGIHLRALLQDVNHLLRCSFHVWQLPQRQCLPVVCLLPQIKSSIWFLTNSTLLKTALTFVMSGSSSIALSQSSIALS